MENKKLKCTNCNKLFDISKVYYRCDVCNEPIELECTENGKINEGNVLNQSILQRYSDFYPFINLDEDLSLGEGFTALVEARGLAKEIGINKLYFKNESQNPTWSFKDRGTYVGVQHALKLGYKKIGTVSTGNMAPSVAAYGSKVNLETFILVNKNIAPEKMNPISIYKPHLIKVDGDYGNMYYESLKIGEENDIYFINSDSPFRVEGSKTIAFEICEQLNFKMPDYIVVPTSAGGNIRGIEKGFREFKKSGLIDEIPKIICAQATGCSPIVKAYEEDKLEIQRFEKPKTIAHAIENPYPPSGNNVLRMLKKNGGMAISVSEEEIIKAQGLLAEIGLFVQPASAVSIAAVKKLKSQGKLTEKDEVVCILTGSGLKYTAAFEFHDLKSETCKLEELSDFIKNHY